MKKRIMKPGTMLNPLPVVLVSCAYNGEDNLITIAWTGIVNTNPPLTYISVRKSRKSHEMILKSGEFVINVVNEDIVRATDFCGVTSGRNVNKFDECGLKRERGNIVKAPLVAESPLNLECRVIEVKEFQSHDMFLAEIISVHGEEALFDDRDRFCLDEARLVAYSHGEYFGLKKHPLGFFGYSIMKPKTKRRRNREKIKSNLRR